MGKLGHIPSREGERVTAYEATKMRDDFEGLTHKL